MLGVLLRRGRRGKELPSIFCLQLAGVTGGGEGGVLISLRKVRNQLLQMDLGKDLFREKDGTFQKKGNLYQ